MNVEKSQSSNFLCRLKQALVSLFGALAGLGLVALVHDMLYGESELPLIIAAFGASAVVLYGCPQAAIAQPRNLFGGSIISAFIGVLMAHLLPAAPVWLAGMLAVCAALFVMSLTGTMHPPGGAIAFIAVAGPPEIRHLGFLYALYPVASGVFLMFVVTCMTRRLAGYRDYPQRWW